AEQHHLELLQALALRAHPPIVPEASRLTDVVQRIVELLEMNAQAFKLSRTKATEANAEEKIKYQASLLEQIRGSTQFVRGEFHPHQFDRYIRAIFARIDSEFAVVYGISASSLLDTLQRLLDLIEDKLNDHRRRGGKIIKAYKSGKAEKAYFEQFPEE